VTYASIENIGFSLFYDYDQLRDGKLSKLSDNGKIEWFRQRTEMVLMEPTRRLFDPSSTVRAELNSTDPTDLPLRTFTIPAFSILLNAIESLGGYVLPSAAGNRKRFEAFMRTYMAPWTVAVPSGSRYTEPDLVTVMWKYYRNAIAHDFMIEGGGIEIGLKSRFQIVNGLLQIQPNMFCSDFHNGVAALFADVSTTGSAGRANFLTHFHEVFPH
jgi:hypothetical protein